MQTLLRAGYCATVFFVDASAQSVSNTVLDEVFVSAECPGPDLWKVSKAADDGEHIMWVFGAPPPIGGDVAWRSTQLEQVMAHSQDVLFEGWLTIVPSEDCSVLRAKAYGVTEP